MNLNTLFSKIFGVSNPKEENSECHCGCCGDNCNCECCSNGECEKEGECQCECCTSENNKCCDDDCECNSECCENNESCVDNCVCNNTDGSDNLSCCGGHCGCCHEEEISTSSTPETQGTTTNQQ